MVKKQMHNYVFYYFSANMSFTTSLQINAQLRVRINAQIHTNTDNNLIVEILKMNPLSNEHHISQQDLLRYVEDGCSRTEMRDIDRHLATCPMCSDAVEGLMLLSNPSLAVAQLDKRINGVIAEKITEKPIGTSVELTVEKPILEVVKRPFWQQRWAAAAAVLLLASGSIWVYKNTQKSDNQAFASEVTQTLPNTELENSAAATVVSPNDTSRQPPQYTAAQTMKKTTNSVQMPMSGSVTNTLPNQGIAQNAPQSTGFDQVLDAKEDANSKNKMAEVSSSNPNREFADATPTYNKTAKPKISADTTTMYAPPTDRTRDYTGVPRPKEQEAMKIKDVGALKTEEKDKTTAYKNKQDVVVSSERQAEKKQGADIPVKKTTAIPAQKAATNSSVANTPTTTASRSGATTSGYTPPTTDYDQIFNHAETYFKQKNYAAAAKEYAQFINLETSGDRPEHALFQLASCYVKLNKKADAKVLFEKLSATDGQYQRAAKKALKDL
jgi:Tetratricopeptide repeat